MLNTVNAEWQKQPERNQLPDVDVRSINSYEDWIATHLELVETFLRQRNTSALTESQRANRNYLLQKLNGYWHERAFPVNDYTLYKTPVFIDRTGNHCAVGYLMQQSGAENLAQQVNREQKFAYVADIKTPGVLQWATDNGFTLSELAWIQPSYWPNTEFSELGTGTNGPVTKLYYNNTANRLIVTGSFDSISGIPCPNIGYYQPSTNHLSCYGSGLQGIINDVAVMYLQNISGVVVAGGGFDSAGVVYPLAKYFQNSWRRVEIPNRQNAIATTVCQGTSYDYEATIRHDSVPSKEELWRLNTNGQWSKQATFHGIVLSSHLSNYSTLGYKHVWTGAFDSVTVHIDSITDTTIHAHNVVMRSINTNQWHGISNDVSDTVYFAKTIGAALYFGGTCNNSQQSPGNICLTRYLNGTLQPIIYGNWFVNSVNSVRDISLYEQNNLLIAGNFETNPMLGTVTKNLINYDPATSYGESCGYFNGVVNTIATDYITWFLGGDFTAHINDSLAHLARIGLATGLNETEPSFKQVSIYPNPTTSQLTITADNPTPVTVSVYSTVGVLMATYQKPDAGALTIPVGSLPPAYYLLRVSGKDGLAATKGFIVAK